MSVEHALESRKSVRAYLPREIPDAELQALFRAAQRAPSWCNIQPWRVWIASGAVREAVVAGLLEAAGSTMPNPDVPFPSDYPEPYAAHRRACGKALYSAMGVARDDAEGRKHAWLRNFRAFDAPHIAIVGVDRRFGLWAGIDVGCWLQSVMLLASERGLATCAMASLSLHPDVLRPLLGIPDDIQVLFGIALGYEDVTAPANACLTTREPVEANVSFLRRPASTP